MSSPFPVSRRDLEVLAERLRRGDTAAQQAAVEELVRLGPEAKPLIPHVTDQIRRGLYIVSSHAVQLLIVSRDRDLFDALVVRSVVSNFGIFEKCQLLEVGLGDFEDELCTYLYRNWRRSDEPRIREILRALRENGSQAALQTLRAIEPDLAEAARAPAKRTLGDPSEFLDALSHELLPGLASQRLELLQDAIRAITERSKS